MSADTDKRPLTKIDFACTPELKRKLERIAKIEGRDLSKQMRRWLEECVRKYEEEHGPLPAADE